MGMGNFIYKYTWKVWSSPISLLANSARGIKNLLFDKYRHCTGPVALNHSQEEGGPFTGKITRSWGKVERETLNSQEGVAMLWQVFFYCNQYFFGRITLQLITQLRGRRYTQIQLCECQGCHRFSERTHDRDHWTQVWELIWKVLNG